jgi:lysylphosphatidylglycerol synthetase-like protein (DUF2156 family)
MTAATHNPVGAWDRWIDRVAGSDPGFNRLRIAVQTVLTIAVILAAEWLFVHFTHARQIQTHGAKLPAAQAAEVALANHAFLAIAMVIGAIVGMLCERRGYGHHRPGAADHHTVPARPDDRGNSPGDHSRRPPGPVPGRCASTSRGRP